MPHQVFVSKHQQKILLKKSLYGQLSCLVITQTQTQNGLTCSQVSPKSLRVVLLSGEQEAVVDLVGKEALCFFSFCETDGEVAAIKRTAIENACPEF